MALKYQPNVGTLWMCDFNTGFKPPEMIKRRPVVVIAPHPKRQIGLCTIVPLSTTTPVPVEPFHHRMDSLSLPAGCPRAPGRRRRVAAEDERCIAV